MLWKPILTTGTIGFTALLIAGLPLNHVANAVILNGRGLEERSPNWSPRTNPFSESQTIIVQRSQLQPLTIDTMRLGGISLQFTESQVRAILGQPQTVDESDNSLIGAQERYLYYNKNGIHGIQLIKEKSSGQFVVFSVLVNDVGAATQNGIQVKDSRQQLIQVLGQPSSIQNQGDDQEIWAYSSSDKKASMSFTVFRDRITEITLSRQVSLSHQNQNLWLAKALEKG